MDHQDASNNDDDDDDGASSSSSQSKSSSSPSKSSSQQQQLSYYYSYYEQYGAPSLLYRNYDSYTILDDSCEHQVLTRSTNTNKTKGMSVHKQQAYDIFGDTRRQYRMQSRWYWPVDYHVIEPVLPPFPNSSWFAHYPCKPSVRKRMRKTNPKQSPSSEQFDQPFTYECHLDGNVDWGFVAEQNQTESFDLQQRARTSMILHPEEGNRDRTKEKKKRRRKKRKIDVNNKGDDNEGDGVIGSEEGKAGDDDNDPTTSNTDSTGDKAKIVDDNKNDDDDNDEGSKADSDTDSDADADNKEKDNNNDKDKDIDNTDDIDNNRETDNTDIDIDEFHITTKPIYINKNNIFMNSHELKRRERVLRSYQCMDINYIQVCHDDTCASNNNNNNNNFGCSSYELSLEIDQERRNRGDPAYNAPFPLEALHDLTRSHFLASDREDMKRYHERKDYKIREPTVMSSNNDNDNPSSYGNCILSVQCPCTYCCGSSSSISNNQPSSSSWYLLHPTGPLMDTVCLKRILFPRDLDDKRRKQQQQSQQAVTVATLDVDDQIKQLVSCGTNTFLARTGLHCTVFQLMVVEKEATTVVGDDGGENDESKNGCCCTGAGAATVSLKALHRFDWRTYCTRQRYDCPSYVPVNATCHPKYGLNGYTDPKIAILCENSATGERNIIRHIQPPSSQGGETVRMSHHHITNLQRISQIEFSSQHPMLLWCAARPYVRPALAGNSLSQYPVGIGHGYSLFNCDLRTNSASFQWSPSHEESYIEGIHSISGIRTDWNQSHTLWVSSISAGKTWELDTRMPCRVVNSWSLPHMCDDTGTALPSATTGLYGCGTIFAQPHQLSSSAPAEKKDLTQKQRQMQLPMLSVGLSPGTFGVHLYQRPLVRPRFQTQSFECASHPGLKHLYKDGWSITPSSVFALPDVSSNNGRVFTCGIAPITVPINQYLSDGDLLRLGYHPQQQNNNIEYVICTITMTNKGDIYAHSLLESRNDTGRRRQIRRQRGNDNPNIAAVGCSNFLLAPLDRNIGHDNSSAIDNDDELQIRITNEYPPTSSLVALGPPPPMAPGTVNDIPGLPPTKVVHHNKRGGHNTTRSDDGDDEKNDDDDDDSSSRNSNGSSSSDDVIMHMIRPRPTSLIVRRRFQSDNTSEEEGGASTRNIDDDSIRLPSQLVVNPAATNTSSNALDYYDHLRIVGNDNNIAEDTAENTCRSDMSSEFLDQISEKWPVGTNDAL